jgi:hypothetical protein
MRHRIGLVLAVVMTGVLFFPGAWGYLRLLRVPAPADQLSQLPAGGGSLVPDHRVLLALAALTGLLLLGWTALYLVSVRQGVDLIPLRSDPFGAGFEAMLFNGILAGAGLAMILPMFVPSRWRSRTEEEAEVIGADEFVADLAKTPAAPTRLTPIRVTSLAPLPGEPWHATSTQETGLATEPPRVP